MLCFAHNPWFDRKRAEQLGPSSGRSAMRWQAIMTVAERRLAVGEALLGLHQLSSDDRALVTLVGVDGLTHVDTPDAVSLPVETVMSRLAHALLAS